VNIDVSLVKLKTEADSNDCSHDKPSTGMFAVSDDIFSAVSCLCILCAVYIVLTLTISILFRKRPHLMQIADGDKCC